MWIQWELVGLPCKFQLTVGLLADLAEVVWGGALLPWERGCFVHGGKGKEKGVEEWTFLHSCSQNRTVGIRGPEYDLIKKVIL